MSKVILEFDLYEDQEDYKDALKGSSYKRFIEEFDNTIFRKALKYESLFDKAPSEAEIELIEALREAYWNLYKEYTEDE
jgi:hypothetical protein